MTKFSYTNIQNGGQEIIRVVDGKVTIQSDCGKGFMPAVAVSKEFVAFTMKFTGAPAQIVESVMALAR